MAAREETTNPRGAFCSTSLQTFSSNVRMCLRNEREQKTCTKCYGIASKWKHADVRQWEDILERSGIETVAIRCAIIVKHSMKVCLNKYCWCDYLRFPACCCVLFKFILCLMCLPAHYLHHLRVSIFILQRPASPAGFSVAQDKLYSAGGDVYKLWN